MRYSNIYLELNILIMLLILFFVSSCGGSKNITKQEYTLSNKSGVDELRLIYNEDQAEARQQAVTVSSEGDLIAFAYDNGTIKVVNLKIGRAIKTFETHQIDLFDLRFNYDATKLILAGNDQKVEVFDIESGKVHYQFKLSNELNRIAVSKSDDYIAFGVKDGKVDIYDLSTNKRIQVLKPGKHHVSGLDFDPNGKLIAVSVMSRLRNRNPARIYNIQTGKLIHKIKKSMYTGISFTKEGNELMLTAAEGLAGKTKVFNYNLTSLKRSQVYKNANWISISLLTSIKTYSHYLLGSTIDQTFDVIDINTGEKVYTTKREKSKLGQYFWNMGIDKKRIYELYNGKSFLINYTDNNINEIYNAETNKITAYLYSDANDDFAVVSRDGRMDGNQEAISKVAWSERKSNKRVPLYATFDRYYTPNLLQILLSDDFQYAKAEEDNLEKAVKLAPEVDIIRPDSIYITNQSKVKVEVLASSNGDTVKEIQILVNGKPIGDSQRGFKVTGNRRTAEVELIPGRSTISAIAITKNNYQSRADKIQIDYSGTVAETDLYVLAIGINDYKNGSLNLNYGRPDAEAFTQAIQNQSSDIFNRINLTTLYDQQATRNEVISALESIIDQAKPQDAFLLFYAGHGVMSEPKDDNQADFYMALHETIQLYGDEQGLKETGVSASEMTELTRRIAARKQMVVLDACQSGGAVETFAMRGAAEQKAIIQLARSAGLVVMASTGTEQYATEFDALGHGVFTYALLNGLSGEADGGSRDGKITIKELEAFINDQVPELTEEHRGQSQYPNSYARGQDFPIVIINN